MLSKKQHSFSRLCECHMPRVDLMQNHGGPLWIVSRCDLLTVVISAALCSSLPCRGWPAASRNSPVAAGRKLDVWAVDRKVASNAGLRHVVQQHMPLLHRLFCCYAAPTAFAKRGACCRTLLLMLLLWLLLPPPLLLCVAVRSSSLLLLLLWLPMLLLLLLLQPCCCCCCCCCHRLCLSTHAEPHHARDSLVSIPFIHPGDRLKIKPTSCFAVFTLAGEVPTATAMDVDCFLDTLAQLDVLGQQLRPSVARVRRS